MSSLSTDRTPFTDTIHTTGATSVPGHQPWTSNITSSAPPPQYTPQGIIAPGEAPHNNIINGRPALELLPGTNGSPDMVRAVGGELGRVLTIPWPEPPGARAVHRPEEGRSEERSSPPPCYTSDEVGMVMEGSSSPNGESIAIPVRTFSGNRSNGVEEESLVAESSAIQSWERNAEATTSSEDNIILYPNAGGLQPGMATYVPQNLSWNPWYTISGLKTVQPYTGTANGVMHQPQLQQQQLAWPYAYNQHQNQVAYYYPWQYGHQYNYQTPQQRSLIWDVNLRQWRLQ